MAYAFSQRHSLDQSHNQIVGTEIVQRANIRVVEGSDRVRLPFKPIIEARGSNFESYVAMHRGSWARYTLPIPPSPMAAEDFHRVPFEFQEPAARKAPVRLVP